MSQRNTTPETSTYVLGRGKLFFSDIGTNGRPLGYRFVGNCPEVTATVDSENYEHFRSTQGLRTKDLDIIIQQSMNWNAVLENMEKENLNLFFSSAIDGDYANPAIAGFSSVAGTPTADHLVANGALVIPNAAGDGGQWYQLMNLDGEIAVDVDKTKVTLASTAGSPVSLVVDVDFEVDGETGRVFFLRTAKTIAIVDADPAHGVSVVLAADATAKAITKSGSGTVGGVDVAVRFELVNAQTDSVEMIFEIHQAGVTANGDVNFISDEVAQLPLTLAVEQNDAYDDIITIYDLR